MPVETGSSSARLHRRTPDRRPFRRMEVRVGVPTRRSAAGGRVRRIVVSMSRRAESGTTCFSTACLEGRANIGRCRRSSTRRRVLRGPWRSRRLCGTSIRPDTAVASANIASTKRPCRPMARSGSRHLPRHRGDGRSCRPPRAPSRSRPFSDALVARQQGADARDVGARVRRARRAACASSVLGILMGIRSEMLRRSRIDHPGDVFPWFARAPQIGYCCNAVCAAPVLRATSCLPAARPGPSLACLGSYRFCEDLGPVGGSVWREK